MEEFIKGRITTYLYATAMWYNDAATKKVGDGMSWFNRKKPEASKSWNVINDINTPFPLFEIRLLEFSVIKSKLELWLRDAGIEYNSLERVQMWDILLGAWLAMVYAEQTHEIRTNREDEYVPESFVALLRVGMPKKSFNMLFKDTDEFQNSEQAKELRDSLKQKCAFSEFESLVKTLSLTVGCAIAPDDEKKCEKAQDALYQFFLRARDDYFQGE